MDFTQSVKNVFRNIKVGSTISYKEVATAVGNEKASIAVARVMASSYTSQHSCHRVIRSDGKLGGYNRGGEEKKRAILANEAKLSNICL